VSTQKIYPTTRKTKEFSQNAHTSEDRSLSLFGVKETASREEYLVAFYYRLIKEALDLLLLLFFIIIIITNVYSFSHLTFRIPLVV